MKKNVLITLSTTLGLLFSCNHRNDNLPILIKKEGLDNLITLTSSSEFENISKNDDCAIFVSLDGCPHCYKAKNIMREYIKENETIIYEVESKIYIDAYDDMSNHEGEYKGLYPRFNSFPHMLFYKGGKLSSSISISLEKTSDFKKIMDNYAFTSNMYCLNDITSEDQLGNTYFKQSEDYKTDDEDILNSYDTALDKYKKKPIHSLSCDDLDKKINEGGLIFFSWRKCKDCKNYKKYILNDFLLKGKKIYFYETDPYQTLKREDDEDLKDFGSFVWQDFSKRYHLSDYSKLDSYSRVNAFVPTVINYDRDDYQMSVFSNQLDVKVDENNHLYYSKAFYKELSEIKSDGKLKDKSDTTSDLYFKLLKNLKEKVEKKDIKLNKDFLNKVYDKKK